MGPQARTLALDPLSSTGKADVLARKPAAEQTRPGYPICAQPDGGQSTDIVVDGHAGPMAGKHSAGKWIGLAERPGSHSSPMQPEAEPADTAEKVKDGDLLG